MSMSEQGEPGGIEEKIEEFIELNHHGHNLAVSPQLSKAIDSNSHTNREGEHWHGTSEHTNDNISRGHGQGKKRDAPLMESNIQVDSIPQSKVHQLNAPSQATCSNNDRAHPSVCTISRLQEYTHLPNISAATAEHETDKKATASMVNKYTELTVTSDVDTLNQNDDQQLSFVLEDPSINKNKELIRVIRYGTNDGLNNLLYLCQNKISFQLSRETLKSCLIEAVRRGQVVKVHQIVGAVAQSASSFKDKDGYTPLLAAAENGFTDMARILLKKGANVNAINNNMDSALILSMKSSGSTELVKLLLSHKANVNLENKYGFTALMKAIETRDFDTCKLLVDAGADVNKSGWFGTALMQLVRTECGVKTCSTTLEIMKLLLQNGARTCSDTPWELNVLCVATKKRRTDMVRLLCEHGVELNEIWDNQTALMIAAELGNLELLEILLDHGANVNIQNHTEFNAVLIALKFGQVDCAKLLLSRGAHLDLPIAAKLTVENKQCAAFQFLASRYKIDGNKDNLLNFAIKMGVEDIAIILINMAADINKGDIYGIIPLALAVVCQSSKSLINCLIQNGAGVNGNGEFVPLHWSVCYSFEITKLLLDSGADVNARNNPDKDTALILVCDNRPDIEIVKLLLAKGAQPNLQNKFGYTALHHATRQANVDFFQLLVESGADLEIQANDNITAYLLAAIEGDIEVIEALQNLGANTSAVDFWGYNALMLAIKFARKNYTKTSTLLYLAGNGAQINHQCNNGYTALMLAANEGLWELLKSLLELGADVNITVLDGRGRKFTALSILLEKCCFETLGNDFLDCVEVFIKHGAMNSLPEWCNDVLHKMIATDKRRMIQLLLTNGIASIMTRLHHDIPSFFHPMPVLHSTEVSPLAVALAYNNIWVAQYLLRNWALCPCDLNFLSLNKLKDFLVANDKSESVEIVDKLLCQPASLLQLSFTTVSHALGGVPGREERINSLPLPQVIKKKLMFREESVQIDLTEDLSLVNLDDYDSDSDYYYEDNDSDYSFGDPYDSNSGFSFF